MSKNLDQSSREAAILEARRKSAESLTRILKSGRPFSVRDLEKARDEAWASVPLPDLSVE